MGSEDIPLGKLVSAAIYNRPFLIYILAVSFTGSEKVGKEVGKAVSDRFGKVSSSFKYYRIGIDSSVIDYP